MRVLLRAAVKNDRRAGIFSVLKKFEANRDFRRLYRGKAFFCEISCKKERENEKNPCNFPVGSGVLGNHGFLRKQKRSEFFGAVSELGFKPAAVWYECLWVRTDKPTENYAVLVTVK